MRILKIIFPFYILALTLMPCTDISSHEENGKIGIVHSEKDHENCGDSCSPFCACNCCGISISFSGVESFDLEPLLISEKSNTLFKISEFSIFNNTIWQPPKI